MRKSQSKEEKKNCSKKRLLRSKIVEFNYFLQVELGKKKKRKDHKAYGTLKM